MLFVRDYYKNNNKENKKKEISEKWKKLKNEEKVKYNNRAKLLLKKYNKMINKEEKIKQKEESISLIEEIKDEIKEEIKEEKDYKIKEIEIENKKYYVDFFNNVIDLEKETYIGYVNDNKIYYI